MPQLTLIIVLMIGITTTSSLPFCQLRKLLTQVEPLLESPFRQQCEIDSTFRFMPLVAPPTKTQQARICKSASCTELLEILATINIPACEISFGGSNNLNPKVLIDSIVDNCARYRDSDGAMLDDDEDGDEQIFGLQFLQKDGQDIDSFGTLAKMYYAAKSYFHDEV